MSSSAVNRCFLSLTMLVLTSFGMPGANPVMSPPLSASPDQNRAAELFASYGKVPLAFEANQGRADGQVKFLAHGQGYTLFLKATESTLTFAGKGDQSVLKIQLLGANSEPTVVGLDRLPGQTNYFLGNDPWSWQTNVPTYARVQYQGVYPGVDLVYYGTPGALEDDFVVGPGADPRAIALDFGGARSLRIDSEGNLVLRLAGGEAIQQRPAMYQEIAGSRQAVAGRYVLLGPSQVGFAVDAYDSTRPLVIDPVLTYSTYLGGNGYDQAYGIAIDGSGNAYVTGYTTSTNFPTVNAFQGSQPGSCSAFVSKLNAGGTALVYSTYLGGSSCDYSYAIAVDATGNAYVAGSASSSNFPTLNPIQSTNQGSGDAFVTKLNLTGNALVYSTYLGGSGYDYAQGIAVDSAGNAYVTGTTASFDFPTANPFQNRNKATGGTAFVSKINASGSALTYSTYLGGTDYDQGLAIAVDGTGNAYLTGTTGSRDFPTKNAIQRTDPSPGIGTGFVSKLNPAGSALVFSTFLGGNSVDEGTSIAVDSRGNVYVTGFTSSSNFPTKNALQATKLGPENAFVTKYSASGTSYVYSTYLGGNGHDIGYSITADSAGQASITGYTDSSNFPTVNAIQGKVAFADVFVSTLKSNGRALTFSTYLGGSNYDDQGNGIAVDGSGNLYVAGYTQSTKFPLVNPLQSTFGGGEYDTFVSKIAP